MIVLKAIQSDKKSPSVASTWAKGNKLVIHNQLGFYKFPVTSYTLNASLQQLEERSAFIRKHFLGNAVEETSRLVATTLMLINRRVIVSVVSSGAQTRVGCVYSHSTLILFIQE